jgi:hypothetical protein
MYMHTMDLECILHMHILCTCFTHTLMCTEQVAMLPFLWNTVHTSKYEIIGAAQQPILLQKLTEIGTWIKRNRQAGPR